LQGHRALPWCGLTCRTTSAHASSQYTMLSWTAAKDGAYRTLTVNGHMSTETSGCNCLKIFAPCIGTGYVKNACSGLLHNYCPDKTHSAKFCYDKPNTAFLNNEQLFEHTISLCTHGTRNVTSSMTEDQGPSPPAPSHQLPCAPRFS